jgi:hypothetical protein
VHQRRLVPLFVFIMLQRLLFLAIPISTFQQLIVSKILPPVFVFPTPSGFFRLLK